MKKPRLFDYVVHRQPAFDREVGGLVCQLLDSQFVYLPATGTSRMCLFNEDWSDTMLKKVKTSKEPKAEKVVQDTIAAPSVWRNHQSRTCIVIGFNAKENVVMYIPTSESTFEVLTADADTFKNKLYAEPIDYPVERAARLFVEFARDMGAQPEVLEALNVFTPVTIEEKEMATKRAAATAASSDAKAAKSPKAKTEKSAKPKVEKSTKPRENMSVMFRELIMRGTMSDDVIFSKVSEKYPNAQRSYVQFYRTKLVKSGEKVPEPKGGAAKKAGRPKSKE